MEPGNDRSRVASSLVANEGYGKGPSRLKTPGLALGLGFPAHRALESRRFDGNHRALHMGDEPFGGRPDDKT